MHVFFHDFQHLLITRGEQAHRPVRAEHQPLGPERAKDYIQIGAKIFFLPVMPVRFGDHSRELAVHVWVRRHLLHERGPSRAIPELDRGLRQMVDDKWLLWKASDQVQRGGQLPGIDENVVGKAELAEVGDAADEIIAHQKTVIRLVLRNVAESAKLVEL